MNDAFDFQLICLLKDINKNVTDILTRIYQPYGLTAAQAVVLMYLHRSGKQNITELSELLCSGKSNISPICKRLEQNGYIVRNRDEKDQRLLYIDLTPQAVHIIENTLSEKESENASNIDRKTIILGLRLLNEYLHQTKRTESDIIGETEIEE